MKIKRKFNRSFVNRDTGKRAYLNHKARIETLLGGETHAKEILNGDELTRGHLAPAGAFSFRYQKSVTYDLKNTAPQWKELNSRDWEKLEDNLRDYVIGSSRDIDVIVGNAVSKLLYRSNI